MLGCLGMFVVCLAFRGKPPCCHHVVLEHQHGVGHRADFVAAICAGDRSIQFALRQSSHCSLQVSQRSANVAADQPGGDQCDQQNAAADCRQVCQRDTECCIQVVGVRAHDEH